MFLSGWKVSPEAAKRLRHYHESALYQDVSENISEIWRAWSATTFTAIKDSHIIINSGHNFKGTAPPDSSFRVNPYPNYGYHRYGWNALATGLIRFAEKTYERHSDNVIKKTVEKALKLPMANGEQLSLASLEVLPAFKPLYEDNPVATLSALENLTLLEPLLPAPHADRLQSLEIGAGAGITAAGLSLKHKARTVVIDLPQTINVSFTILSSSLPELKLVLPHEVTPEVLAAGDFDILYMVPEQRALIGNATFDLALSTNSFQEMDPETIAAYFQLIYDQLSPEGIFFCKQFQRSKYIEGAGLVEYPWDKAHPFVLEGISELSSTLTGANQGVIVQSIKST